MPAATVYSGVLYDALGLASLPPGARRRAIARLLVVSASTRPGGSAAGC